MITDTPTQASGLLSFDINKNYLREIAREKSAWNNCKSSLKCSYRTIVQILYNEWSWESWKFPLTEDWFLQNIVCVISSLGALCQCYRGGGVTEVSAIRGTGVSAIREWRSQCCQGSLESVLSGSAGVSAIRGYWSHCYQGVQEPNDQIMGTKWWRCGNQIIGVWEPNKRGYGNEMMEIREQKDGGTRTKW